MKRSRRRPMLASLLLAAATVAPLTTCEESGPMQPGAGDGIDLQLVITSPSLPATAPVGSAAPPVSVQVLNKKNGQIIYSEPVSFVVTAGGGTVYAPTVQTDNMTGIAQDLWTLGTRAGFDTLQARVVDTSRVGPLSGSASVATFTIQAVPLAASVMSAQAGNGQTAVAASTVAVRPAVLVTDRFGNPIVGVTVAFAASGGGSVTGASQTTNASGIATVGSWTLGATAGPNTLTASSTGLTGSPVTFTATGINGAANQLIPATSTAFAGTVASTIPAATGPAVRVVDPNNNGVPNIAVTFSVTGPTCPSCAPYPGTSPPAPAKIAGVASVTVLTDASGRASGGDWTLSTLAGANTLQATAVGLTGSPVIFTAAGTAGPAALLFRKAGEGQSASVGAAVAVAVQVTDVYGNPSSSGTPVTFAVQSGGGSVTPNTVTTDLSGGAATSWTLGRVAGANTLGATVLGKSVTFSATATGPAGLNITDFAGDAQTAAARSVLPIAPAVQVTDQNGHAVSGVTVSFRVTTGGGSITAATQVTNTNGTATVGSWTLGPGVGINELQAAFNTGVSSGYTIFVATAVLPSWTQTLTGSGDVWSLAADAGGLVFAATANGVYRSSDNGTTWTLIGLVPSSSGSVPSAVAVNPANHHVFAGLSNPGCCTGIPGPFGGGGSGVYRSTDGGGTWTYILGNPGAFGFAFTPAGSVIAATSGPSPGSGGLFIWPQEGGSGAFSDCCYPRAFAITSSGSVFAADAYGVAISYGPGGVFRSTDAGATWTQVGLANSSVYALVATGSDHLFAGTASTGIYRSTDGVTWIQVNGTFTNPVTSLVTSPGQVIAGVYGGGVLRSNDDGGTWTSFNTSLTDLRVEALSVGPNGLIFAGTPSGIFVRSVQ